VHASGDSRAPLTEGTVLALALGEREDGNGKQLLFLQEVDQHQELALLAPRPVLLSMLALREVGCNQPAGRLPGTHPAGSGCDCSGDSAASRLSGGLATSAPAARSGRCGTRRRLVAVSGGSRARRLKPVDEEAAVHVQHREQIVLAPQIVL
jgi:hypothetical protein